MKCGGRLYTSVGTHLRLDRGAYAMRTALNVVMAGNRVTGLGNGILCRMAWARHEATVCGCLACEGQHQS